MKKEFKVGAEVAFIGKVTSITETGDYPIQVSFGIEIDEYFTINGQYSFEDKTQRLFRLSDLQTNVFTDEELDCIGCHITQYNVDNFNFNIRESILTKINQLTISQKEKELIELAKKLGYKVEKL